MGNLFRKIGGWNLKQWTDENIIGTVKFQDIVYYYSIPKGFDYNIYLNPYFHEYEITTLILRNLKPNNVFIDVGTHGGLYSIIAGIRKCRVFSFEPNPINLRYLKENLTLNGLANVVVIPEALSDYNGIFRLYYSATETALSSGVRLDGQEQIDVKCSKLDDVLKLNCIETVDFLKIDTEGCDLKVLKGATDILKITKNLVIEENDAQVRNLLASLGFSFYTLKPSGYLLAKNDNLYKYP